MIDPITQYILEGYLFSDKTISVNLDDFKNGTKKKLLIVGVMGSGKTTLGEKLSKDMKVKWYSLDSFWWRIKEKHFKDKTYKELSREENDRLFELFEQEVFKVLRRNERSIIEGINMLSPKFRSLVMKQSMIILGVSSIIGGIRAGKRNRERGDDEATWRLLYWMTIKNINLVEPLVKKFRKDVQKIPNVDIKEYKI
ncbi:MAG: AAA family ATPase [Candidatus Heimdallarchaeaceae archaeon]